MPVEALREHVDPAMGRPTQELYSVAGLLVIKAQVNQHMCVLCFTPLGRRNYTAR